MGKNEFYVPDLPVEVEKSNTGVKLGFAKNIPLTRIADISDCSANRRIKKHPP